ncbi:MAG: alpha/beta hydrolase [Caldilineales bacterium]|nr:alpha/beta hydrolase [Caldilineales bacterium]
MNAPRSSGYFRGGLPYNRLGHGPRPLVVFQGLAFENKPQPGLATSMYRFLGEDYTVFTVLRRPGLPQGYTLQDMADDYAAMIRAEFGGPVDVIGISTGGSIAQHFAADHPDLVRRLVIHSSAHRLSDPARAMQLEVAQLAGQRRWREAWVVLLRFMLGTGPLARGQAALAATLLSLSKPADPSDLVITVLAEDQFSFQDQLARIAAPTLVVAGNRDPFYTPALFQETAAGIPNARLILYPGMGHPASGKQFQQDVLAFLREDREC